MTSLLQSLVDSFLCWIKTGVTFVANAVISALGAIAHVVLLLLPPMPTLPAIPADLVQGATYGNYFFPIGYLAATVTTILTLWLGWFAVQVVLRWAKVIR